MGLLGRSGAGACPNLLQRGSGPGSAARRSAEYQRFAFYASARSGPLQQIWTTRAAAGSDGDHDERSDRLAGPAPPRAPKRALRTRKCSSNRRSRVQNAPLESEMHISTSRGPAITSWASAAPAPPRSISGDPTRRGAAILISSEAVARRSGSARSWAGADPSPACAMRAQRNETRLGLHHASSARQNPPALNPREPAAHHAIPGDITKTTPPGAGAGRGRREGAGALTPPGRA